MAKHEFRDEDEKILYSCDSICGMKNEIIKNVKHHLTFSRSGCVDHYLNGEMVQRYSNNPKTGKACLEIDKGDKTYYKTI